MLCKYGAVALLLWATLSTSAAQQDLPLPVPGVDPGATHLVVHSGVAYLLQDCRRDTKRTTCQVQLTSPSPDYNGAWFIQGSYCIDAKVKRLAVDLRITQMQPQADSDFPVLRAKISVAFAGVNPNTKELTAVEIAGDDGIPFSLHYADIPITDIQESTKTVAPPKKDVKVN